MSERVWTKNQLNAIEARNMQILVSAAAGSGKTAVLTERVKRILSDTENKCAVSEILVVTFTRAAAAEMRDRIYKALSEAADKAGESSDYLHRQMTLLPTADICTIDSFCAKIVRENFHLANVGADFTILDDKDNAELMAEAVDEIINELYEENDKSFESLTRMFLTERDDNKLQGIITTLYNYSRSYPSPILWLDEICEKFSPENTPDETGWSELVYKYIELFSDFHISRLNKCVALMEAEGGFSENYLKRFTETSENLMKLKAYAEEKAWDDLVEIIKIGIVVKPPARNSNVDEFIKGVTQDTFKELEDDVVGLLKATLPTEKEHKEDCKILYPCVKKLCEAVKRLTEALDAKKSEKKAYTFDDILHKCIDLLVEYKDGVEIKTPLAIELSKKYKEILIDEYQDTNRAQNKIFDVISRNKTNIYAVGDVKQSIYRFRLASPDLFTELKTELKPYDGKEHPSKILLEKNFRSREGITRAVNEVFSRIMSEAVGDIDYNEDEYLYCGADYPVKQNNADVEVICIGDEATGDAFGRSEPEVVADYIKAVVESGATVGSKDKIRKVRWGDFCILLRSAKKKSALYGDALKKYGIPVSASLEGESSDYKEIRFLTSLVKTINNPLVDIPLIAVMMSPVFGFTPDELAEIRMIDKESELYACLLKYAEKSNKAKAFLDKINLYRNICATNPVNEFVSFLVKDTAVSDIYYAAGEGTQRKANINGFIKLADDFTNSGRNGLNDFVRYMDNAEANGAFVSVSDSSGDENSVKIMSIHKSKGLEFPYVIVADCSKGFNKQDSYGDMTVTRETGIGLKLRDDELFTRYNTLSSVATEKAILFGDMSEELRVLYVAMTRAKEHLTFVCDTTTKSLLKRIRLNSLLSFDKDGKLHPFAVYRAKSMSDWVLTVFSKHIDCGVVRELCSLPPQKFEVNELFRIVAESSADISVEALLPTASDEAFVDEALLAEITENVNYSYPYDFSGILAKRTASSTEKHIRKREYFANTKPSFLQDSFSGADRGTAIHKFLEMCDFKSANENLENEIARLKADNTLTEKELEVLDRTAVKAFLESDIGVRMLASDKIFKEYEFSILKAVGELYGEFPENAADEQVVVEGKLDCAFVENGEAVLIDYKTDNITDESLFANIYSEQLKIYADALCQCTDIPVKEKYIYSFKFKKFIPV